MKIISKRDYLPNSSFRLFLSEAVKYYEVRKKHHPKMSSKEDIEKMINSIDIQDKDNIVIEEFLTIYDKGYYRFSYKGFKILIG